MGSETKKQRMVIKLGTSVLTGGTHKLNRPGMMEIVRQCAILHEAGHDIILCSSGAITAGRGIIKIERQHQLG